MQNKTKVIVIVGSEGFLGKNLVRLLRERGHEIIGIDIQPCSNPNDYRIFIQKNLNDLSLADFTFLNDIDNYGLVNVGGVSRNGAAAVYPYESSQNTISGFAKLLELMEQTPPAWMVLTSTREVDILLSDKRKLKGKQRIYPSLKLTTELIAEAYGDHWQIPLTVLRLSDIFGLGDHPSKAMQIFLRKAIENETINVFEPEVRLYLTEVNEVSENVYEATIRMIEQPKTAFFRLLHVWDSDYSITLLELAYLARELNPLSRCTIVASENQVLDYCVMEKIKDVHKQILQEINAQLIRIGNGI